MPVFILSLGIFYLQNSFAAMQQALREHMGNETTGKLNGNHIVMSPSISHSSGTLAP